MQTHSHTPILPFNYFFNASLRVGLNLLITYNKHCHTLKNYYIRMVVKMYNIKLCLITNKHHKSVDFTEITMAQCVIKLEK